MLPNHANTKVVRQQGLGVPSSYMMSWVEVEVLVTWLSNVAQEDLGCAKRRASQCPESHTPDVKIPHTHPVPNMLKPTLSSWHKLTSADKYSAAIKASKCKTNAYLLDTSQEMQIHDLLAACADTSHYLQVHPQPLVLADTGRSRYMNDMTKQ
jgi:hypothetical protein